MGSERGTVVSILLSAVVVALLLVGAAAIWGGDDVGWTVYMLIGLSGVTALVVVWMTYRYWQGRERSRFDEPPPRR